MTRLTDRAVPELDVDIMLDLILGPTRCTEQELRLAWHAYRGEFGSGDCGPPRCACRMWAYWKFEIGEERPEGEDEARTSTTTLSRPCRVTLSSTSASSRRWRSADDRALQRPEDPSFAANFVRSFVRPVALTLMRTCVRALRVLRKPPTPLELPDPGRNAGGLR